MTDDTFRSLTRDLHGCSLTPLQAKQLKELIGLAVLRGAQTAAIRLVPRVTHDPEYDDK